MRCRAARRTVSQCSRNRGEKPWGGGGDKPDLPVMKVLRVVLQLREAVSVGIHRHEHGLHNAGAKFFLQLGGDRTHLPKMQRHRGEGVEAERRLLEICDQGSCKI